ncbi:Mediator of RNA polymerase II transcription subunit 15a [Acorus calamus]|uniref:Mediator of RNA polymerase II transcription subunit 15a n=1 Tax=Acorus calamus TaxID=4465 RepID=A0AAV9D0L8_ACOCL|nr:Mediator of RNA polymerase II transcription subunit 15a [Acorus calamus]
MDPSSATVDWRSQLQQESRPRVINKIIEILKRHLPSGPEAMIEIRKIATDYLQRISQKMSPLETMNQKNPGGANPLPPNAGSGGQNPPDLGDAIYSFNRNMGPFWYASWVALSVNVGSFLSSTLIIQGFKVA